jgi:hypothetical protein
MTVIYCLLAGFIGAALAVVLLLLLMWVVVTTLIRRAKIAEGVPLVTWIAVVE